MEFITGWVPKLQAYVQNPLLMTLIKYPSQFPLFEIMTRIRSNSKNTKVIIPEELEGRTDYVTEVEVG